MKKKYQVFISSTYEDLREERTAVISCLLESNCIPVAMEHFPASNMSPMQYIEEMLDDCDYYILILAGKYGSLDSDEIGYTEKEYDYAVSKGIPVMSFIVKDIKELPYKYCEHDGKGKEKLEAFRKKVSSGRMVRKYSDIGGLKSAVIASIHRCIEDYPALGWIRGTAQTTIGNVEENAILKVVDERIEEVMKQHIASDDDIDRAVDEAFKEVFG